MSRDTALFGGSSAVVLDATFNSANLLLELSTLLFPAVSILAGDLGGELGLDQQLMTKVFAFIAMLYVLHYLTQAGEKLINHANDE